MTAALRYIIGVALLVVLAAATGCSDTKACDCDPASEYCVRFGSDVAGEPDTFECFSLPQTCLSAPACGCLEGAADNEFDVSFCFAEGGCDELGDGVLQLSCPGG